MARKKKRKAPKIPAAARCRAGRKLVKTKRGKGLGKWLIKKFCPKRK